MDRATCPSRWGVCSETGTFRRPRCFSGISRSSPSSGPARSLLWPSTSQMQRQRTFGGASHPAQLRPGACLIPIRAVAREKSMFLFFFFLTFNSFPFIAFTHNLWSKYIQPHLITPTACKVRTSGSSRDYFIVWRGVDGGEQGSEQISRQALLMVFPEIWAVGVPFLAALEETLRWQQPSWIRANLARSSRCSISVLVVC